MKDFSDRLLPRPEPGDVGGAVSLPPQSDAVVGQGAERARAGRLGGLKPDALDTFDISLDAERAKKTVWEVPQLTQVSDLRLVLRNNPGAKVSVSIGGHDYAVSGQDGALALQESLPKGRYVLVVCADRPEKTAELNQALITDCTPPFLSVTEITTDGATFTVSGGVSDTFASTPLLTAELAGQTATLHASGPCGWTLPLGTLPADLNTLKVSTDDEAGDRTYARLP